MTRLAILPLLAVAACATVSDQPVRYARSDNAELYATLPATGEAESCVRTQSIRQTESLSDRAMLFEMDGGKVYRNELNTSCPALLREDPFQYRSVTSQLCRGEILTFFQPTIGQTTGSCSLGEFVPIGDRQSLRAAAEAAETAPGN